MVGLLILERIVVRLVVLCIKLSVHVMVWLVFINERCLLNWSLVHWEFLEHWRKGKLGSFVWGFYHIYLWIHWSVSVYIVPNKLVLGKIVLFLFNPYSNFRIISRYHRSLFQPLEWRLTNTLSEAKYCTFQKVRAWAKFKLPVFFHFGPWC